MCDEFVDVPESRVVRTLGDLRPFRSSHIAFETIQQAIHHSALSLIEGHMGHRGPKFSLGNNVSQCSIRTVYR